LYAVFTPLAAVLLFRRKQIAIVPLQNSKRRLYCPSLAQTPLNGQIRMGEQPNLV
jgi:hypothetical protein